MSKSNQPVIPIEEQFKIMADTAPVLIWVAGVDKLCYFFNVGWLKFTGRAMEQEYGNGWAEGIHPDDLQRRLDSYTTSFDEREEFKIQYRLRRFDGEYRWLLDNGVPRYLADGTFAGYIGSCIDIDELLEPERRKAENIQADAIEREQSINEELAASNEEIKATNEELKESQEKLEKLNAELEARVIERTRALKESETNFRNLILQAPVSIAIFRGRNHIVEIANHRALELWGRQWEDVNGRPILEVMAELQTQGIKKLLDDVYNTGKAFSASGMPLRLMRDGELVTAYIDFVYEALYDGDGNINGVITIGTEVTEQKLNEIRQAMLASIIESSEDAIISKGLDGIITSWNQSAEKVFGYTEAEVIGKHISIIIPENRMNEEQLIIEKIRKGEKIDHFETVRVSKSGEDVFISLTVSPMKNKNGEVIGASKIVRDISKQKTSDERLQNYAERLEILNSIGHTISEDLDMQAILQKVTDATTQLTGASFGAFFHNMINEQGETYMLYTLSGAPKEAFEKFGTPRNTRVFAPTFNGEGIVRVDDITKDPRYGHNSPHSGMPKGHLPVVSYLAVPVVSKSGDVIGGLFFGHVEAAKFTREHEQLVAGVAAQAAGALDNAKLYEEIKVLNAKKDEFIGLASHELKTPITSINGYLQIIERSLSDDDRHKSFVNKALQQVGKLTTLISDLLDVSKIQTGKLPFSYTAFNLVEVLNDVTEMMQHSHSSHLIELDYDKEPIIINADQQRMEQVVINLITNAVKYSPGSNRIIIQASESGGKVKVSVQDFGIGIASGHQERIFSRFYRVENLASHMSGLGIGLYICQEIITRHNGKMWVNSKPGEGSTFFFEIPVS